MKRVFLFLYVLFYPFVSMAEIDAELASDEAYKQVQSKISGIVEVYNDSVKGLDRCAENGKHADEFTIDRRCYVTDEQKRQSPYNAVVGISDGCAMVSDYSDFYKITTCSGVIIKNSKDGQLYIYTAGHCAAKCDFLDQYAATQDGQMFTIKNIINEYDSKNYSKDYAVYAVPQEYQGKLPYVETASFTGKDVDVLGYTSLSIINDSAIRQAKQEWAKVLKSATGKQKQIVEQINSYVHLFPKDKNLKASFNCEMLKNTNQKHLDKRHFCQGFHGDSGGPVFDSSGRLTAVVSHGRVFDYSESDYIQFAYDGGQNVAAIDKAIKKRFGDTDIANQQNIYNSNANIFNRIQQQDIKRQLNEIRQLDKVRNF